MVIILERGALPLPYGYMTVSGYIAPDESQLYTGYMIHGGDPEADYPEAVDPIDAHRTYVETDIPIPEPEEPDDLDEDSLY